MEKSHNVTLCVLQNSRKYQCLIHLISSSLIPVYIFWVFKNLAISSLTTSKQKLKFIPKFFSGKKIRIIKISYHNQSFSLWNIIQLKLLSYAACVEQLHINVAIHIQIPTILRVIGRSNSQVIVIVEQLMIGNRNIDHKVVDRWIGHIIIPVQISNAIFCIQTGVCLLKQSLYFVHW